MVDSKFEKPKTTPENKGKFPWGSNQEGLLIKEKDRATKQKEKNDEYLPLFEMFYKALQYINQK